MSTRQAAFGSSAFSLCCLSKSPVFHRLGFYPAAVWSQAQDPLSVPQFPLPKEELVLKGITVGLTTWAWAGMRSALAGEHGLDCQG